MTRSALPLLEEQLSPKVVAQGVGVNRSRGYAWRRTWRLRGLAGTIRRQVWPRSLDAAAEAGLEGETRLAWVLHMDPQARGHVTKGWTAPMLRVEARKAGFAVGAKTLRRSLYRLGWRWKQSRYVLGRPEPACKETGLGHPYKLISRVR